MKIILWGIGMLLSVVSFSQTISAARSAAIGSTVTVTGIVLNGAELGPIRYIQDATGGIAAYSSSMLTNILRGDSVTVSGVTKQYNNLLEIDPVSSAVKHTSGNALPTPAALPTATLYSEAYESQLVRLTNVTFSATGTFTGNANYNVIANGSPAIVRVGTSTNLVGTPIPSSIVTLTGIMSQFSSSNPSTGYQMLLRDLNDITFGGGPIFTTDLIQRNIAPTSFDIFFKTQRNGNTLVYYGTTPAMGQLASSSTLDTNHLVTLSGLTPGTVYYVRGASVDAQGDTSWSSKKPFVTASTSSGKILAYFNQPVDASVAWANNPAAYLNRSVDDTLIAFINRAKRSIDISIYNWNNTNTSDIAAAVNAAHNRGVRVRVVIDGSTANVSVNSLNSAIQVVRRNTTQGIMHNKFVVFDVDSPQLAAVWTGSTNWTEQQMNLDCNNVVVFEDQSLARAFTLEFEELLTGTFGPNKTDNTPKNFNLNGTLVELFFSPSDDVENRIREEIRTADSDIEVAVMQMTRTSLSGEMIARFNAGAFVAEVVDDTSQSASAPFLALKNASPIMAPRILKWAGNGIMHHKFMIVDQNKPNLDAFVLTGSHNWSSNANFNNDENTVVIHDPKIANQFFQHWLYMYKLSGGTQFITKTNDLNVSKSLVYPNPAQGEITLEWGNAQELCKVSISDLSGKVVFEKTIRGQEKVSLPSTGVYFVRFSDGNKSEVKKVLIQK
ncbi:MAG: hypothetical protein RIS99_1690 [Bacteroidota bacterium]|jgi:phosphatidylserine/phosphatidylglycerophosphate/cardiolipin synthase-like enzyme